MRRTDAAGGAGNASLALPILALLGAIVSVQFGATLAKGLFSAVGAQGTVALRNVTGALILGVATRPWRARLSWRAAPALGGYGATLAVMNSLFYLSLRTVPLGIAVALEFLGPLLVATLASRRAIDFLWIALAAAGIALLSPLVRSPQPIDPTGAAFALGAGAAWALYIVFGQKAGDALGHHAAGLGLVIAAILALPFGIAQAGAQLVQPSILLGALTRMPARVYGTLTSLDPAFGAIMGLIVLGEALTPTQWAGIGIVMLAALGVALTMRKPAATPEQVG
jgi:inner membrane transporter RhtA